MKHICLLISILTITLFPISITASSNLITSEQPLNKDQTLVSTNQNFELGFFNSSSGNWYIGIWYKSIQPRTCVWVLNRDQPVFNSSSGMILKINPDDGDLILSDESLKSIWSTNLSRPGNAVAELLDSGNFVLRLENDTINPAGNYLWQSFDHPTDTLLPGMRLGWDKKTGFHRFLTSWKASDDPSTGDYSFKMDINGFPEIYLYNKQMVSYRNGPWNGMRFSGVPEMKTSPLLTFDFFMDLDEVYYTFYARNDSVLSRLTVSHAGSLQRLIWVPTSQVWSMFWYAPKDQCDDYRECGVYGICDTNASPVCKCMMGFTPKNQQAWNLRDGSDGCVRVSELSCVSDGFMKMSFVKLPQSDTAFVDREMSLDQCREMCKKNCSCSGFSNLNVTNGGSGCVIWSKELYDMRQYADSQGGQDFYVRVSKDDLEKLAGVGGSASDDDESGNNSTHIIEIVIIPVAIGFLLLVAFLAVLYIRKRPKPRNAVLNLIDFRGNTRKRISHDYLSNAPTILSKRDHNNSSADPSVSGELELPLFDLTTLLIATDEFSDENKLGEGGFGSVYKGKFEEGQEIAVKRLSDTSLQGIEEFKNEMKSIARLQHRNLVRLLGCCIEKEEKMLIYEYMENKSLDSILFDKNKNSTLNWAKRFNIISGIARGLLYLHQDSRFRIIHRDLKASNILLDKDMNPKISDFGMARIFGSDQTEANTKRVVGTYGYMSPEYAMDGIFSVKSDVFSFGVLVLEIVNGQKNRGFYQTNNELNLLAYAWKLYGEGRGLQLMDSSSGENYSESEVMRCIQVGLLCVQEHAKHRPNMSDVVLMLSSDGVSMPQPKNPGFFLGSKPNNVDNDKPSSKAEKTFTANQVTVTILDGR